MTKSLVIVESPAKSQTIKKYLGDDFEVVATVGHVIDLPVNELGVEIENNFKPSYKILKGKLKIIGEIKKKAEAADKIYLASDPDREGEAIAWHIAELIKLKKVDESKIFRASFNEITKDSVIKAINNPGKINSDLFDAQQSRRILDRLVGYLVSPLLWENVQKGLSAGRVQSVALRIICEREKEIKEFIPQEYWSIEADVKADQPPPFKMQLDEVSGKKLVIKKDTEAKKIIDDLKGEKFVVNEVTKKKANRNPSPPFITSTLQQEAVKKLRYSAKQTMQIAQKLYEGIELGEEGAVGLITYMRTDSTRISDQAVKDARDLILSKYGKDYLPPTPPKYASKKGAQEAHEAVRPTDLANDPEKVKPFLDKNQYKLYKMIWDRFISSQMVPAVFNQTKIECLVKDKYNFTATGSVLVFDGYQVLYKEALEEIEQIENEENKVEEKPEAKLPDVKKGDKLKVEEILPGQHFTKPPASFTESSLVKYLEQEGIGRPSTYATIISVIQEKEYVAKENRKFTPTELGFIINDLLVENFPDIFNVKFTAMMEEKLDKVEEGSVKWVNLLKTFYKPFEEQLEKAKSTMRNVRKETVETEIICEKCGKNMVIKWGRNGRFLACPGFPGCRNTKSLDGGEDKDGNGAVKGIETDDLCEKCGKKMIVRYGRKGRFLACPSYPECTNSRPLTAGIGCPMEDCDGKIVERKTRTGKIFYACDNYPTCKYATWEPPVPKKCEKCGHPYMILKRSGPNEILKCPNTDCEHSIRVKN